MKLEKSCRRRAGNIIFGIDLTTWLQPSEFAEWDAFVSKHPQGLVYHLSAWKEALEKSFRHINGYILVLRSEESGAITDGISVYMVKSWLLGNRIVSVPFASICNPLVSSSEDLRQLIYAADKLCNSSSGNLELRNLSAAHSVKQICPSISSSHFHHYLPLDKSLEALWGDFSRTSIRQVINRASRMGISVERRNDNTSLRAFYRLSVLSRKKLGLPPIPFAFFDALFQSFSKGVFSIFVATLNSKIIGALITLKCHGTLHLEYSGTTAEAERMGVVRLLYWEAIKYAAKSGCKSVSFGRTECSNSGLREFKRRWATIEEPIFTARTSLNGTNGFSELYNVKNNPTARWIFAHTPYPIRLLIGSFVYRHHG